MAAEIIGDTREAQAFIKASAAASIETPATAAAGKEGEAGEGKRKKRKQKHLGDETQGRSEVLAAHPLSVIVRVVPAGGDAPDVQLAFSFLPRLGVVTVKHVLSNGVNGVKDPSLLQVGPMWMAQWMTSDEAMHIRVDRSIVGQTARLPTFG